MSQIIKAWLLCSCALFYCVISSAQYTSSLYDFDSTGDAGNAMAIRQDGSIFLLGGGRSYTNQHLGTLILSNDGTQLLQKHDVNNPNQFIYTTTPGNLLLLPNGDYLTTTDIASLPTSINHFVERAGLIRFDADGNVILTKNYTDTNTVSEQAICLDKLENNGDLLIGGAQLGHYYYSKLTGMLIRTDSVGNEIWRKFYAHPAYINNNCRIQSVQSLKDGRIFVCAELVQLVHYSAIFDYLRFIPWLFVTDSAGNILKDTTLVHYSGYYPHAFPDKNGGYMLYGGLDSFLLPYNPYSFINFPAFVAHLDTNFNFTWVRNFATSAPQVYDSSYQIYIHNVKQLADSSYLLIGEKGDVSMPAWRGWACKMERGGRILWKNYYTADTVFDQALFDAVERPDKSILFCGQAADHTTPQWRQYDVWLLGVDSNGCAQPGCPPTAEPVGVAHSPTLPKASLLLYPNPTTGSFTLRATEAGVLTVYSVQGTKVAEYTINPAENKLMFAPTIAGGIYYGRFTSAKGNAQSVRIIYQP